MQKSFWRLSVMLLALTLPTALLADTYSVNQALNGATGVTGTITTDGTIGVLGTSNILDWNLTLNDGTNVVTLTSANSSFATGRQTSQPLTNVDLTATATNLFFNYSGSDGGYISFGGNGSTSGELCYTSWSNCFGPTAVGLWNVGGDSKFDYVAQTGNQVIATVVATPEPGSLLLLGSGLLGLSGAIRKKLAK